jgi:hypothetical protein
MALLLPRKNTNPMKWLAADEISTPSQRSPINIRLWNDGVNENSQEHRELTIVKQQSEQDLIRLSAREVIRREQYIVGQDWIRICSIVVLEEWIGGNSVVLGGMLGQTHNAPAIWLLLSTCSHTWRHTA